MQILSSLGKCVSAAIAAGFLIATVPAATYAADAPMRMPPPGDAMAQQMNKHIQEHLDKLAARLEIKASQEAAWQSFSSAMRDLMASHMEMSRAMAHAGHEQQGAEADAATLARKHADQAADHARKLAQVADATAKLEQSLGPEQKQVFDEVARNFAHEHFEHHAMMHGGHWWHDGQDGEHCGGGHRQLHDRDGHGGEGHGGAGHDGSSHGGSGGSAPDSGASMSTSPQ
jgi:hypothetical protein